MISMTTHNFLHLLTTYGYWAVFVFIAIESMGIPFPGETMLLVAAIYAGTTHHLSILLVIVAAASGAILGDNLGFMIGRVGGYRLLRRYGRYIRLDERKLKLGQYLFMKHGGKVVFFGRFVAVLRAWAAFLAGTNRMPWPGFLLFNTLVPRRRRKVEVAGDSAANGAGTTGYAASRRRSTVADREAVPAGDYEPGR